MANPRSHALMLSLLLVTTPAGGEQNLPTREAMQEILQSFRTLVRETAGREPARNPNLAAIRTALQDIGDQSALLADHLGPTNPNLAFLAGSLDWLALTGWRYYEWGGVELWPTVMRMAEVCTACHTRLAARGHVEIDTWLLSEPEAERLPLPERARLQAATRRFEAARETWAQVIGARARAVRAADAVDSKAARGVVEAAYHYLILSLRVQRDPFGAARTLEDVARATELPAPLARAVARWQETLRALDRRAALPALARARLHAAEAQKLDAQTPWGGLVHHVAAGAHLHQLLELGTLLPEIAAEIFYRLGDIEERVASETWLTQAELYFEASIRAQGGSHWARKAYVRLDRRVRDRLREIDASGKPMPLPDDVREHLERLAQRAAGRAQTPGVN